ncbi:RND transporter [Altererythrobacter sp. B11]|uniref:efflux transporter outer membrane subunit n=1 Tax=Altererythrobacter sp. B11 TaxID=2060312 RepID=UPI000DC6DD9E|nr:efflux transporter outer membrane subunit [Altererythrobacter sp. B11]BBC74375.1 RND transporter [Altererythrobacter sp. B11]
MTRRPILSGLVPLLLAGCASVPHVEPQVTPVAPTSLGLGDEVPTVAADWWRAFNDPQLDRLEAAALAGNPRLEAAEARLREAEAAIGVTRAAGEPQIGANAQVTRQRFSENATVPPPYGGSTRWLPQLGATLDWDLDLFGRVKAGVRQAEAEAAAARYDTAAARLTLSAAVAQTYVALARAEAQIAVADRFVDTRQQALSLAQTNVNSGLASDFELQQSRTLLAEAEQARALAVASREVVVHALAALVGRGADFHGEISPPVLALGDPPAVPAMLPADLLARRPDILAARARITAASAGREAVRADFLPNINISALAGLASVGFSHLFEGGSAQYAAGPAIHLPIFEGGRLQARYKGATAAVEEYGAEYNATVLDAVRDTADAITRVGAADRELADQQRIVGGLRETLRLNQVRVDTGLASRIDTLESGFRLLAAEQSLVDLQADALTRRIQLLAALGGGFDSTAGGLAATDFAEPQS